MLPEISKISGIHPGAILKREIKSSGLKNKEFAKQIDEYAQTLSAVLNGKRGITPYLSIKLGKYLGIELDYFMILQASYDVKRAKEELLQKVTPNLNNIRPILFWDTNFSQINWTENKKFIIQRIFERGNEIEIKEIIHFYGKDSVKEELENIKTSFLPSFEYNFTKYIKSE